MLHTGDGISLEKETKILNLYRIRCSLAKTRMEGNGREFNNRRGIIKIYSRAVRVRRKVFLFLVPFWPSLCRDSRIQGISSRAVHPPLRGEHSTFPIFHETRGTCMTRRGTARLARRKARPGEKVKTRQNAEKRVVHAGRHNVGAVLYAGERSKVLVLRVKSRKTAENRGKPRMSVCRVFPPRLSMYGVFSLAIKMHTRPTGLPLPYGTFSFVPTRRILSRK